MKRKAEAHRLHGCCLARSYRKSHVLCRLFHIRISTTVLLSLRTGRYSALSIDRDVEQNEEKQKKTEGTLRQMKNASNATCNGKEQLAFWYFDAL
uniref:Uncharacterized protein n=1 Tax=Steinernema glaseri TaxID=37863 RepID=A0A1I8A958_9BILA